MQQLRSIRSAMVLAGAALALVPASAGAVTFTLTDDGGTPQPWTGEPALRTMSPSVGIAFGATEKGYYSATFAGPDGAGVSSPISCYSINTSRQLDFRGNGAYTVTVQQYGDQDFSCKTPVGAAQVRRFSISAGVGLTGPARAVLIRQPNSYVTQPVVLPFSGNPGALGYEIRYARNGVVGGDGGLSGVSSEGYVDSATGTVPLRLTAPGRYIVVARAKGFSTGTGQFFSPWSAPIAVTAKAPFDVESSRTTDWRGPSYRIRVQLREHSARGRVAIAIAKGRKGGRYRSFGSAKLGRTGVFAKRFTLRQQGFYRVRFRFKGSATVAGGTVVAGFRITRRLAF